MLLASPAAPAAPAAPAEPRFPERFRRNKVKGLPPKQIEFVDEYEKLRLAVVFIANNIISRQISGILVNRMNGKISQLEHMSYITEIESRGTEFKTNLDTFVVANKDEIMSTCIRLSLISQLTDLLITLSLKGKNANQKEKLREKLMTIIMRQGINFTQDDPLENLRKQLSKLSLDDQEKLLKSFP